eukprot:ctg_135.g125
MRWATAVTGRCNADVAAGGGREWRGARDMRIRTGALPAEWVGRTCRRECVVAEQGCALLCWRESDGRARNCGQSKHSLWSNIPKMSALKAVSALQTGDERRRDPSVKLCLPAETPKTHGATSADILYYHSQ